MGFVSPKTLKLAGPRPPSWGPKDAHTTQERYASLLCEADSALLIACRSLEDELIPLGLEGANFTLFVCDTRVKRGLADTGYQKRRETCEKAAQKLGVDKLRDAWEGDLGCLSGDEPKRARHVVRENDYGPLFPCKDMFRWD